MKKETLFTCGRASRHRWVIFFVFWILVCLAARYVIVWYKTRPPNHIHVHDLTWSDRTDANNVVYRRWRYFLKPRSYLPLKVEKYSKLDPNDSYALEEALVVSYLTTDEIRRAMKDAGFGDLPEGNVNMKGHKNGNE